MEYYEEAVEWAKMRVRSFLNVRVKPTGGWQEMREELKRACDSMGSTMFMHDTKLRLRNATDGILFQPLTSGATELGALQEVRARALE